MAQPACTASEAREVDPVRPEANENEDVIALADYFARPRDAKPAFLVSSDGKKQKIPPSVHRILVRVVREMARGSAISIVPVHHELTTQEAADLLNVSRPHLVKLLTEGALPFHMVGTHRRVRFDDLMAFRDHRSARRREILRELAEETAKLGL